MEEEVEVVGSNESDENKAPSFEELGLAFDNQLAFAFKIIDSLSKNAMARVLKKQLAWPLKDDTITLVHRDETLPYETAVNIQQLKTNMMLEQIRLAHEEEANKLKESKKGEVNNG
ncbi:MAG TPA: hypothetical protein V6C96_00210 [Vampirovibrionales bacterium]